MTSIKSGPNCINDTQVQGMTTAIVQNYRVWLKQSRETYSAVKLLDIAIGLTYGTDRTTNNKENQILAKLLDHGFVEEDRTKAPGVLIDAETRSVRIYRRIGKEFWAFDREPFRWKGRGICIPGSASRPRKGALDWNSGGAIRRPNQQQDSGSLYRCWEPEISSEKFTPMGNEGLFQNELFWFATAITAFYDEGI